MSWRVGRGGSAAPYLPAAVIWTAAFTGWSVSTGPLPRPSRCPAVRLQLMSVLAAASFHPADLLGFVCCCCCGGRTLPAPPGCVVRRRWTLFSFFLIFIERAERGDQQDVLIFIQKLSAVAVVVHGAVGLRGSGHQHQGAAARRPVEEALRTTVGQVVPQVRTVTSDLSDHVGMFYMNKSSNLCSYSSSQPEIIWWLQTFTF